MESISNPSKRTVLEWLNTSFNCAQSNDRYLINAQSLPKLESIITSETNVTTDNLSEDDKRLIQKLLYELLLNEADETRGLIGVVAIDTPPLKVAGAVLAVMAIIIAASVPGTVVAMASCLRAALSMISVLTHNERYIVSLIAVAQKISGKNEVTFSALLALSEDPAMNALKLSSYLSSMVHKGALKWDSTEEGTIILNSWT